MSDITVDPAGFFEVNWDSGTHIRLRPGNEYVAIVRYQNRQVGLARFSVKRRRNGDLVTPPGQYVVEIGEVLPIQFTVLPVGGNPPGQAVIGPAGGLLEAGPVRLIFPAGALLQTQLITASFEAPPAYDPAFLDIVGQTLSLEPDGLRFAVPVVLEWTLPSNVRSVDDLSLAVFTPNQEFLVWHPSSVVASRGLLSAELNHFSRYSLLWPWSSKLTGRTSAWTWEVGACPSKLTGSCNDFVFDVDRAFDQWEFYTGPSSVKFAPAAGQQADILISSGFNGVLSIIDYIPWLGVDLKAVAAWDLLRGQRVVALDDTERWHTTEAAGTVGSASTNILRVVTHEIGHHFGLGHTPGSTDLMNGGFGQTPIPLNCTDLTQLEAKQGFTGLGASCAATLDAHGWQQGANYPPSSVVSASVRVADAQGDPVGGVPIRFAVTTGGGGLFLGKSVVSTDHLGVASVQWQLGPGGNQQNSLRAFVATLNPSAVFLEATTLGAPAVPVRRAFRYCSAPATLGVRSCSGAFIETTDLGNGTTSVSVGLRALEGTDPVDNTNGIVLTEAAIVTPASGGLPGGLGQPITIETIGFDGPVTLRGPSTPTPGFEVNAQIGPSGGVVELHVENPTSFPAPFPAGVAVAGCSAPSQGGPPSPAPYYETCAPGEAAPFPGAGYAVYSFVVDRVWTANDIELVWRGSLKEPPASTSVICSSATGGCAAMQLF